MTRRQCRTLYKRIVDSLPVDGRDTVHWDRALPGFGVRVYATGSKVYIAHARSGGKPRRVTIGRHGTWSTECARREAESVSCPSRNTTGWAPCSTNSKVRAGSLPVPPRRSAC